MPLRDHFHPKVGRSFWERLHGAWPTVIVQTLNRTLPPQYVSAPKVHHGAFIEVDVAAFERDDPPVLRSDGAALWSPSAPTLTVVADAPTDTDEYEIQVYDVERGERLVAAVELVSPANKDRPENRRRFVAKCAALLQNEVSVAIVDLVTNRHANLYGELLEWLGRPETPPASQTKIYAAECRYREGRRRWYFETWEQPLEIGQPLPTLPLWLSEDFAVPLDLEATYEETCRGLRIA